MAENDPIPVAQGLHVVYGSRTRRGLAHANEDRHAVASWRNWCMDIPFITNDKSASEAEQQVLSPRVPEHSVCIPSCVGSARKDTTLSGFGATGGTREPFAGQSCQESSGDSLQNALLWTVCDGHDGPEAADFVCQHIADTFAKTWHQGSGHKIPSSVLKEKKLLPGEEVKAYARGYALSNALARTFEGLDSAFKSEVWSENQSSETRPPGSTAGSCVTSIFLSGNLMCCAGLGDCKAAILTLEDADSPAGGSEPPTTAPNTAQTTPEGQVARANAPTKASQQFQVTWFSKDHRSSCPKERARIRSRGGWFRLHRVGGVLEPTRTIGDFDVKASQPPGVVIATPEVRTFTVTKPALVLIATDGVWDVMDASQLLRSLKKRRRLWRGILSWLGARIPERRSFWGFRKRAKSKEGFESMLHLPTGGDLVAMAETLVTRAHDLGSDDDCTCICIYLRPGEPPVGVGIGSGLNADESTPADESMPTSKHGSSGEEEEEVEEEQEGEGEDDDDEEDYVDQLNVSLMEGAPDAAAKGEIGAAGGTGTPVSKTAVAGAGHHREKSSGSEEKWKRTAEEQAAVQATDMEDEEDDPALLAAEEENERNADWRLPSTSFPLSFYFGKKTAKPPRDDEPGEETKNEEPPKQSDI